MAKENKNLGEDKNCLRNEADDRARERLGQDTILVENLVRTVANFAYRYIQTKRSGEVPVEVIRKEGNLLELKATAIEDNLETAMTCQDPRAQQAITSLSKTKGIEKEKGKTTVCYKINCVVDISPRNPWFEVSAMINWDYPGHETLIAEKQSIIKEKIKLKELIDLRKKLPQALEKVCAIF